MQRIRFVAVRAIQFSVFSSNFEPPGPAGAVWNRAGLEKKNSKLRQPNNLLEN